jgi:hypothetical protein
MQGDDVFVFGGGKDWFDGGAGVDHVRFGFQKQIGILNLDGSFLKVLDFFGNEATLFDVESLEFSDVTVPTNELVLQLQSGKFSLQVESLTGTGYQLSDQIRSQADTGTARSKVVWFGDDWTESFQTDVGRFLQWSATSPDGNPTVGNLKLPDALKLIESGLSGPDSTLWKDLIALLADMRVGADGQLKFDGYFDVIAQESISSKGVGSYDFVLETVDEISKSSAIKQTVRIEGEWTGFFKAKVTQFLEWSATSPNGNPAVGALSLEDALKLIESGIQGSDAFAWKNIVGLLADMRVDKSGQLTFDGYLSPFTQQSIVSRGMFDYGLEITSVEDLSESVPSRQVVKVDDQWTDFFVSKVGEFLNWSRTSPEGNPTIGALSTTNALAILDELLKQDPLGASNLIGLLADFSVSASGSLIFDGNFG